jgi:succinate dehydrogenase/fumarate reductase-like Fe-S protein
LIDDRIEAMSETPLLRDITRDQTEVLNRYRALLRTLPKKADNKDKKMIREA